jgi:RimJ/RimL family protein N-acetyltransferase
MIILETKSLRLVPLAREHYEWLFGLYADAEVMRYIANGPRTREVSRVILDKMLAAPQPQGYWVITDKKTDEPLGAVLLIVRAPTAELELGFMLEREVRGRGYATEAARAVTQHGLLYVERIEAFTHPENLASQAVLRKVGYVSLGEAIGPYGGADIRFAITRPSA